MGDVLGTEGSVGETLLEGSAKPRPAVLLQELVKPVDVVVPNSWAPLEQLGQVVVGGFANLNQMLPLEVPLAAFSETAATCAARCSGSVDFVFGSDNRGCVDSKRAQTMRILSLYRYSVPAIPMASGCIEYKRVSWLTKPVGPRSRESAAPAPRV